jgi:hypothetical protein
VLVLGIPTGAIAQTAPSGPVASAAVVANASAPAAAAQQPVAQPTDAQLAEAETLVTQGVAERRAGNDLQALETFRRAYAIAASPRIRAQMALAEQALGQWIGADADLRGALVEQNDPWITRNRASLEAALVMISARLASVGVSCAQAGARLFVNGRESGVFPLADPIRVETGSVVLEVRLEGYRTIQRTIMVEAGRSFHESFTLVRATSDSAGNPDVQQRVRVVRMIEEYVPNRAAVPLIITGAVLAVGGVGANIFWQNRVNLYNSSETMRTGQPAGQAVCYMPTAEYPTRYDRCGAVLTESWIGFGLMLTGYVAGAGLVATGLALRLVGGQRRMREQVEPISAVASVTCTPSLLGISGVTCGGVF